MRDLIVGSTGQSLDCYLARPHLVKAFDCEDSWPCKSKPLMACPRFHHLDFWRSRSTPGMGISVLWLLKQVITSNRVTSRSDFFRCATVERLQLTVKRLAGS